MDKDARAEELLEGARTWLGARLKPDETLRLCQVCLSARKHTIVSTLYSTAHGFELRVCSFVILQGPMLACFTWPSDATALTVSWHAPAPQVPLDNDVSSWAAHQFIDTSQEGKSLRLGDDKFRKHRRGGPCGIAQHSTAAGLAPHTRGKRAQEHA